MSDLEQLERKVESLSTEDLTKFREWFMEFDWRLWDSRIEENLKSGKLDRLISGAMADFEAGKAREF